MHDDFSNLIPERIVLDEADFDAFCALLDADPTPEQQAALRALLSGPTVFDA